MKYTDQILFGLSFGLVFYFALDMNPNTEKNIKNGLLAIGFFIIMEGYLKSDKGPFPEHKAFWRSLYRACVCYLAGLIFLAYQNQNDARQFLKYLYPSLGQPVSKDMHTYDDNCEIELDNILDNFDHYYLCHLIMWFLVTFVVRNRIVLHTWSILDEIIGNSASAGCPRALGIRVRPATQLPSSWGST